MLANKNRQLESRNKETVRELESARKELKMIIESSKHRKPKRESSIVRKEKDVQVEENTVVRNAVTNASTTSI